MFQVVATNVGSSVVSVTCGVSHQHTMTVHQVDKQPAKLPDLHSISLALSLRPDMSNAWQCDSSKE